jgi:hypothetical protein
MITFWFHFNKPKTQQTGEVTVSLHYDDRCHFVKNVVLNNVGQLRGRIRKSQPRFAMVGKAKRIKVSREGIATIEG